MGWKAFLVGRERVISMYVPVGLHLPFFMFSNIVVPGDGVKVGHDLKRVENLCHRGIFVEIST